MMSNAPTNASSAEASRSLLSRNSRIKGELEFPGLIEVLGHIDGQLKAESVIVGEHGEIEGSIAAKTIVIKGSVKGDIVGASVTLHTGSRVAGEITYQQLVVEAGALVDGRIHKAK